MNLLAFLSDRCNMKCSYCFLSLNEGPAHVLSPGDLERAIDAHRAAHPGGRVTLLGGEPSLHWELLRGAARHAGAPLTVVTNGTRLRGAQLDELRDLGAQVCVSLDGEAEDHDRERKLLAGGSSLEAALETLEDAEKAYLRVNMVITPGSAGRLLRNIESVRKRGFRKFSFHPDVMGEWDDASLAALRAALASLRSYIAALGKLVEISHSAAYADACGKVEEITLGADGYYYPCDGLFSLRYAQLERFRCGSARDGLNGKALADWNGDARRQIHGIIGDAHRTCPREPYFRALAQGRDPRPAVERYAKADAVLGDALCALAA